MSPSKWLAAFLLSLTCFVVGVALVAERAAVNELRATVTMTLSVWGGLATAVLGAAGLSERAAAAVRGAFTALLVGTIRSSITCLVLGGAGAWLVHYSLSHHRYYVDCRSADGSEPKVVLTAEGRADPIECGKAAWLQPSTLLSGSASGFRPFEKRPVSELAKEMILRPPLRRVAKWQCLVSDSREDREPYAGCGAAPAGKSWTRSKTHSMILTGADGVRGSGSRLLARLTSSGARDAGEVGIAFRPALETCRLQTFAGEKPPDQDGLAVAADCASQDAETGASSLRVGVTICTTGAAPPTVDERVRLKWLQDGNDAYEIGCSSK